MRLTQRVLLSPEDGGRLWGRGSSCDLGAGRGLGFSFPGSSQRDTTGSSCALSIRAKSCDRRVRKERPAGLGSALVSEPSDLRSSPLP